MPGLYDQLESHLDEGPNGGSDQQKDIFHNKKLPSADAPEAMHDAPPLFGRLNKQLDDETVGLTTMDIFKLKGLQKQIMLLMLRDSEAATLGITYSALQEKLSQPDDANLREALEDLAKNGWIIVLGEMPNIRYRAHMRRKRGSELGLGIWANLSQRLPRSSSPEI